MLISLSNATYQPTHMFQYLVLQIQRMRGSYSGANILAKTYHQLLERTSGEEFRFGKKEGKQNGEQSFPPTVTIAEDSDDYRIQEGFMRYERAQLFTINNQRWILALGHKTGDYPGDEFSGDLLAIPAAEIASESTRKQREECIRTKIQETRTAHIPHLAYPLVLAMRDGRIVFPQLGGYTLEKRVKDKLNSLQNHVIDDKQYLSILFLLDDRPTTYKLAAAAVLTEGIEAVLAEKSSQ